MAHFAKLDGGGAGLLKTLFPVSLEYFDLISAFQRWEREDIDLTEDQLCRTVAAIRKYAIPDARALVARHSGDVMDGESRERLHTWESLAALLELGLRK